MYNSVVLKYANSPQHYFQLDLAVVENMNTFIRLKYKLSHSCKTVFSVMEFELEIDCNFELQSPAILNSVTYNFHCTSLEVDLSQFFPKKKASMA